MTLKELSQLYYLNREIEMLNNRLEQCNIELARLNDYIAGCPDSLTRQILSYRFIDGLSWDQVAAHIGGITPAAAKMTVYRYIREK